jgi:hypothetical protein
MNKMHWNRINNRAGSETAAKLHILFDYYCTTKVSDYYKKETILLQLAQAINAGRPAEIVVCPHFGKETIRGINSQKVILHIHNGLPKRLLGFRESGLIEVLNEIQVEFSIKLSTKEFIEIGHPLSFFEEYTSQLEPNRLLIKKELSTNVTLMTKDEVVLYAKKFLPHDFKNRNWPEGFWIPQSRHAVELLKKDSIISIQSEVVKSPTGTSFYKQAFEKQNFPIIGYRTKKS